jgi:hypothetical protein
MLSLLIAFTHLVLQVILLCVLVMTVATHVNATHVKDDIYHD